MSVDLALDRSTGDLAASPSNDLLLVSGIDVVRQRIRTRLKIQLGTWTINDDTEQIGSTLDALLRLPVFRVIDELPLVVKEALAPMSDIRVIEVDVAPDPNDPKAVGFTVSYQVVDDQGASDVLTFSDQVATL